MIADVASIVSSVSAQAFGKPLVTNVFRGLVVEAIIASALCPEWTWCSADYASWDFQHSSGVKLEVKQSALRQTWASPRAVSPRWDIAPRTGFWQDYVFTPQPGRNADLYVLALHSVIDDTADHRNAEQWRFYVIRSSTLPAEGRTIGLSSVERLSKAIGVRDLARETAAMMPHA